MVRPHPTIASIACACLTLLATGCSAPGIGGPCDPFLVSGNPGEACPQQMYFPTGLAIDPAGDTLYVSNGNADLRYAGGTVQALDVGAFNCAHAHFKRAASEGVLCQPYPLLLCAMDWAAAGFPATTPAGCDRATLDALFNEKNRARLGSIGLCRPDLLDPTIIECDEQLLIAGALAMPGEVSKGAVRVGNFAGALRVQPKNPKDAGKRRLWVAVRGDPSITWVDVARGPSGVQLECRDEPEAGLTNNCKDQRITVRDFHDAEHQPLPPDSPGTNTPGAPGVGCDSSHTDQCVAIPAEPFGLAYDEGTYDEAVCHDGTACDANQACTDRRPCLLGKSYQHLLVSHLLGGEVMLVNAAAQNPTSTSNLSQPPMEAVVLDVRGVGFDPDAAGRRGGFGLAAREPGNPRSLWYASSRVNPRIGIFRVGFSNVVLPFQVFGLVGPFSTGDDVRDLVFDPCADRGPGNAGCRAFAVQNHPPSLFTLDTRIDPRRVPAGVPQNTVSDIVNVCQGPSHLAFRSYTDPLGGPARNRVYVLCYAASQMAVVDPDRAQLVDQVLVGRGPNEIAFNFGAGITTPVLPDGSSEPARAYITSFLDNSISVVDLQPGSDTENHVIARIGFTEPPRLQ